MSLAQRQFVFFISLMGMFGIVGLVSLFLWFRSTQASTDEFIKGISIATWTTHEYGLPQTDATLSQVLKPMGVTWVAVVVTCYQDKTSSRDIICGKDRTPSDESLRHVIQYAHRQGMRVILKPHVDLYDDEGHWRGEIGFGSDETAWRVWFESYTRMITYYARLAQENGVEYYVVGTELEKTSHRADQWRAVIKAARAVYKGPMTYAANMDEGNQITWWDTLDAIGVDAYFSLTNKDDPSVQEIKAAWSPIVIRLEELSQKWNRPIIFTEVGYRSLNGANKEPWNSEAKGALDLQEQADCYRAVFETFKDKPWWRGVIWWGVDTNPTVGGSYDTNFTPHDKPAEDVLRFYYGAAPRRK
jgi:hypothetical protein